MANIPNAGVPIAGGQPPTPHWYSFFAEMKRRLEAAVSAAGVTSIFTRTGDVVAEAGDYSASQITNDSAVSGANVDDALETLNAVLDGKADLSGAAFTGDVSVVGKISNVTTAQIAATFRTNLDTAAAGPVIEYIRDSASPAANDVLALFNFYGRDSGGNFTPYTYLQASIVDPTNGSEDGLFALGTTIAGAAAFRLLIGGGLYHPSVTGGDKGNNTLNYGAIYENNVPVITTGDSASDTAAGIIEIATQAEQETGTDTTRAVAPGRQQFHPSAAKFWAYVTVAGGTPTLQSSYNVTSITDANVGTLTVTIDNDFSSANWAVFSSVMQAGLFITTYINSQTAGTVQVVSSTNAASPAVSDPAAYSICGFGDR